MSDKIKILVADGLSVTGMDLLKSNANFTIDQREKSTDAELFAQAGKIDGLILGATRAIDLSALAHFFPRLQIVAFRKFFVPPSEGNRLQQMGIAAVSAPTAHANAVAEHTIGMLYQGYRGRGPGLGYELSGKVLGVIGLGRVGIQVCEKAMALGMRVFAYDPAVSSLRSLPEKFKWLETRFKLCRDTDEVFSHSNAVTLHVQGSGAFERIVTTERLEKMQSPAFIVNGVSAECVDERAILQSLESGKLWGAAFDGTLSVDSALAASPNVWVSQRHGAQTVEAIERIDSSLGQQILEHFNEPSGAGAKLQ